MSFAPHGAPCGYETDDTPWVHGEDHDQQTARTSHPDRPVPLLIHRVCDIHTDNREWISEYLLGLDERDAVFRDVLPCLL
jgi:hypothetical protein